MNLTASERLPLETITLTVGQVTENVTVKADAAVVQTASSERSGVLTSTQVENLMIKGRNVISLLQLLPGVVDTSNPDAPDRNFAIGLSINGQRRNAIGTSIDGVQTQDSGVGWISTAKVSMDAVAEVKVLLNNYQCVRHQLAFRPAGPPGEHNVRPVYNQPAAPADTVRSQTYVLIGVSRTTSRAALSARTCSRRGWRSLP